MGCEVVVGPAATELHDADPSRWNLASSCGSNSTSNSNSMEARTNVFPAPTSSLTITQRRVRAAARSHAAAVRWARAPRFADRPRSRRWW